jgi:hypothetical protein
MIARSAAMVASRRWPAFRSLMIVWRVEYLSDFGKSASENQGRVPHRGRHPRPVEAVVSRPGFGVRLFSKAMEGPMAGTDLTRRTLLAGMATAPFAGSATAQSAWPDRPCGGERADNLTLRIRQTHDLLAAKKDEKIQIVCQHSISRARLDQPECGREGDQQGRQGVDQELDTARGRNERKICFVDMHFHSPTRLNPRVASGREIRCRA